MRILLVSCFFMSACATSPNPVSRFGGDFHMHVNFNENNQDDFELTGERALLAADSVELSRVLILPNGYQKNANKAHVIQQNDFVRNETLKNPTRIAGACAVNPMQPWAKQELARCWSIGLRVLKIHFMASGMDLKNAADFQVAQDFLTEASRLGFTMLVHGNYPSARRGNEIEKLKELIEAFPKTRWIIGHLFGREHKALIELRHPNFFVEVSVTSIWANTPDAKKDLVETMRAVGIQKFIFGSDWPVFHPAETLKAIRHLGLTNQEINSILFENAKALGDLFAPSLQMQ